MYAVVGCDECSALWIVEGNPETSQCPRCGRTRGWNKRRKFVETDDEDHAREVRGSMLASRQGHGDEFAELGSFKELGQQVEESGIDDETYLSESGIDVESVQNVESADSSGSQSREEIVREALDSLTEPTANAVVEYANKRGVPEEYTQKALKKLVRAGDVVHSGRTYRLV